jgi:hypothetical protein
MGLACIALGSIAVVMGARKLSALERALIPIARWTSVLSGVMLIGNLALYLLGRRSTRS